MRVKNSSIDWHLSLEQATCRQLESKVDQNLPLIVLMLTQSLFYSWDVAPHFQALQKFRSGCFLGLHLPSSRVSPSHDAQSPNQRKNICAVIWCVTRGKIRLSYMWWQPPHLSEPLKAANRLIVPRSIFMTLPQPLFIPHCDVISSIHVTSICKRTWL